MALKKSSCKCVCPNNSKGTFNFAITSHASCQIIQAVSLPTFMSKILQTNIFKIVIVSMSDNSNRILDVFSLRNARFYKPPAFELKL